MENLEEIKKTSCEQVKFCNAVLLLLLNRCSGDFLMHLYLAQDGAVKLQEICREMSGELYFMTESGFLFSL